MTQPGYSGTPMIELMGRPNHPDPTDGILFFEVDGASMSALTINSFSGWGVHFVRSTNAAVYASHIGTGAGGLIALGNREGGILVEDSSGITIGSSDPALRNVISGNGNGRGLADELPPYGIALAYN